MIISESYKNRLKALAGIIVEVKHTHKNEFGALMLQIEYSDWQSILDTIDKEDIYDEKPGYGLEKEPHITVLFGFHKGSDFDKMKELVNDNTEEEINISIKGISHFETPDYDVVKFDIDSKKLHQLNKIMVDNFEYTNGYPDYHPHMTIAYVKKGTGKKYDKKEKSIKMTGSKIIYSPPYPEKKQSFTLDKEKE